MLWHTRYGGRWRSFNPRRSDYSVSRSGVKNSNDSYGGGGRIKPQVRVFAQRDIEKQTNKNQLTATKQNNIKKKKKMTKTNTNTVRATVVCDRRTTVAARAVAFAGLVIIIIIISHDECYWNYHSWSYLARTRVNIVCDTYTCYYTSPRVRHVYM